jgi:hypothetical protein
LGHATEPMAVDARLMEESNYSLSSLWVSAVKVPSAPVGHEHPEDHVALGRAATRAAPNSISDCEVRMTPPLRVISWPIATTS